MERQMVPRRADSAPRPAPRARCTLGRGVGRGYPRPNPAPGPPAPGSPPSWEIVMTLKFKAPLVAVTLALVAGAAFAAPPPAKKAPVTDTYFGTKVVDDYRWIENLNAKETTDWIKTQADYSKGVLDRIPGRDALLSDFVHLDAMRPAVINEVMRKNGRYFYKKTLPTESVGRIYYRDGLDGKETLLFDPTEGAAGKSVSVAYYLPSEDGRQVALGVAQEGSESATIRIMNVEKRTFSPETISPCWQGIGGGGEGGSRVADNLMKSDEAPPHKTQGRPSHI